MLLQAQGPFQELDRIAQVSLVTCSLCRYWDILPGTRNAGWVNGNPLLSWNLQSSREDQLSPKVQSHMYVFFLGKSSGEKQHS